MGDQIRQRVTIDATPIRVFEALMDSKKHAAFIHAPASVSREVGGRFTAYGTYIEGLNVELIRGKRIVQAWRGSDWPEGAYSIATFELAAAPGGKTKLTFRQNGVPAKYVKSIEQGWKDYYWKLLKDYFAAPARKKRRAK